MGTCNNVKKLLDGQVWQAILTKKVDLDSRKIPSISDGARELLKVIFFAH